MVKTYLGRHTSGDSSWLRFLWSLFRYFPSKFLRLLKRVGSSILNVDHDASRDALVTVAYHYPERNLSDINFIGSEGVSIYHKPPGYEDGYAVMQNLGSVNPDEVRREEIHLDPSLARSHSHSQLRADTLDVPNTGGVDKFAVFNGEDWGSTFIC